MKLSLFAFDLPDNLIASYPTERRDGARLMVADRATEEIFFHTFKELPTFFNPDDVLVLNDSRVFHGQLSGYKEKTKSAVTVLLLRELDPVHHLWDVWLEPARKVRTGNRLLFGESKGSSGDDEYDDGLIYAGVIDNTESRGRTLKFGFEGSSEELQQIFEQIGHPPLPSFLQRSYESIDKHRYQTIYAKHAGSVAPPSAGFAFTPYILKYLELYDVHLTYLTHHLNVNRFKSIEAEELSKFRVDTEYYNIPEETANTVNEAILRPKSKICVVGTSSLKAVETAISHEGNLKAGSGMSFLFPHPPFSPKVATSLLTGFHRPRSIDFVNTLSFAGDEFGMEIYETAVEDGFRFGPYGDLLLIT